MNVKFIISKVSKNLKQQKVTNQLYKGLVTIATLFNIAKGEIFNKEDIQSFIDKMDSSYFSKLDQKQYTLDKQLDLAINGFCQQFKYRADILIILKAFLVAYQAHVKVNTFQYFYQMHDIDEEKQKLNVNLLDSYLDKSRKLNDIIIEKLKYNYSFVIEYARNTLMKV